MARLDKGLVQGLCLLGLPGFPLGQLIHDDLVLATDAVEGNFGGHAGRAVGGAALEDQRD
ncbi:MAG: hypothetical protein HC857_13840 [Synechococcales cyanobacterium RU_4_20]|nr:hypothetical protein [Synechococcales cyanobacterium RU_4_20]